MEAKQLFEFSSRWLVCDGLIQPHFGCTLWYPVLIKALKTKKMDMFCLELAPHGHITVLHPNNIWGYQFLTGMIFMHNKEILKDFIV